MARLVHTESCECTKSELDLFNVPMTQTSVEHGQWMEYHPLATLTDNGPVEFMISGSGEDYLDLSNTHIYVRAQIVNGDGTHLAAGAKVAPVNYWINSLWSQIDLSLNEKLITASTSTYPYRAYLETLLSYGPAAKDSHLTASLWFKDTAGKMSKDDFSGNEGYKTRQTYTAESRIVDMQGKLHLDMFFQDRYLLNGVDVRIRLVRSKDSFSLLSEDANPSYRIRLHDVTMFVRKVKIQQMVQLSHIKTLEKGNAKYPIRRIDTKVFSVSSGNLSINQEHLFLGQLPKRLVIGCVDNDAYNGTFAKSPYEFKHCNINFLALYLDGRQIPAKPLQPNFSEEKYVRSYLTMYTGTGQFYEDEGNQVSRDDYPRGYTLFAFDLTPDLIDGSHFNVIKHGNIRLELHFAEKLENTINVIVYGEFDNLIEIDRNRNIIFDYNA